METDKYIAASGLLFFCKNEFLFVLKYIIIYFKLSFFFLMPK